MKIAIAKWYYMDQQVESDIIDTDLLPEELGLIFISTLAKKQHVEMQAYQMSTLLNRASVKDFPCSVEGHLLVVEDPS